MLGTAILVLVAQATLRTRPVPEPGALRAPAAVMLLVPVLVAFNGLTPYLELKTGIGWNRYSNLRTVAGQTNHLLVPATVDLSGAQSDLVEVLETSDPDLAPLIGSQYAVVFGELLEYAGQHPEESLTYLRGGQQVVADPIADEPSLHGDVSAVSYRLQSFRVVDVSGSERCLPVYSPAR